jgi:hypothetical protein
MSRLFKRAFGVSIETANGIALIGLLFLGGGVVVGLVSREQAWATGLLCVGGSCFIYYFLHAIFGS